MYKAQQDACATSIKLPMLLHNLRIKLTEHQPLIILQVGVIGSRDIQADLKFF